MLQKRLADHGRYRGVLGVVERDDDEPGVAGNIGVGPDDRDCSRHREDAVGVEGQLAAQEVVERVTVEQRAGRHEDQALIPVGNVDISVHADGRSARGYPVDAAGSGPGRSSWGRRLPWRTRSARRTAVPAAIPARSRFARKSPCDR